MKVYQAIAKALSDVGVTHLFGVIGDGNLFMVDNYARECGGRYVRASNEAGAVLMALGYARVAGTTGVATVTHGPALVNTATALVEGVKASVSMVLLAGDTGAEDWEHPQKINQRALVLATGAGFEQLRAPNTVAEDLNRAFYRAWVEMRPIVFNMPVDYQWRDAAYEKLPLRFPETHSVIASSPDMDEAIGIIASSHRPVVVGGRGVATDSAEAAVLRFAKRIGAPVATSVRGKGLFASDPFNLGICGTVSNEVAVETVGASDCMVVFGASLNRYTAGLGGLTKKKRIIQISPLASQIGRYTPVTIGLVGDPGLTADAMIEWLDEADIPSADGRTDELRQRLAAYHTELRRMPRTPAAGTVDLFEMLQFVNDSFPKDRVYVAEVGRLLRAIWPSIEVRRPRDFVDTAGFCAIGQGVGEAVGAAVAAGGRPTLLVTGDGGLMLGGLSELATIVREKLNLVIVVCNDGSYGSEYVQFVEKGMNPDISVNHWAEFASVAKALGFQSRSVTNMEELRTAMKDVNERDTSRPFLLDVKLDPAMTPYYYITSAKHFDRAEG